jgi:hypothetical protein
MRSVGYVTMCFSLSLSSVTCSHMLQCTDLLASHAVEKDRQESAPAATQRPPHAAAPHCAPARLGAAPGPPKPRLLPAAPLVWLPAPVPADPADRPPCWHAAPEPPVQSAAGHHPKMSRRTHLVSSVAQVRNLWERIQCTKPMLGCHVTQEFASVPGVVPASEPPAVSAPLLRPFPLRPAAPSAAPLPSSTSVPPLRQSAARPSAGSAEPAGLQGGSCAFLCRRCSRRGSLVFSCGCVQMCTQTGSLLSRRLCCC